MPNRFPSEFRSWWDWMEEQVRGDKDLYVYFNNDVEVCAVSDALRLKKKAYRVGVK